MRDTIQRVGFTWATIFIVFNTLLFFGGYIPESDISQISSVLRDLNISNPTPNNFVLQTTDGDSLQQQTGSSFAVSVLDFIQDIPVIGAGVKLFRIVYELLVTATFGVVFVMLRMQLPDIIVGPIGVLFFIIYGITLYQFVKEYLPFRK